MSRCVDVSHWPTSTILGTVVHGVRMGDVMSLVDQAIQDQQQLLIGVVNAAKLVNMRRNPSLDAALEKTDITLADGMAVVWGCKLLGRPIPERIAGIDLMHEMLRLADRKKYRVYCLGAAKAVLERVVEKIHADYPSAVVAGFRDGYFGPDQEEAVAEDVLASRADMIFVAISPPKKEQFLAKWSEYMQVPVCHGVGGSFDVMAGKVKRAPVGWQKLGLEWLYRVVQEPRRMWRRYLVTNTLFCWMLFSEWLGKSTPSRKESPEHVESTRQ